MHTRRRLLALTAGLLLAGSAAGAGVGPAAADHSWGSYHWARTANPFTLKLGDNLSGTWDPYLATTSTDWSASSVLDTAVESGRTSPRSCSPTAGRVEVCSAAYGNQGWLGVTQIWVSGTHITQGIVKVNDTYFNTAAYNTPAWRNLVMCQEVGHTLGLHHQDETFANSNLGTCMDYTNDPAPNQHPNAHDYAQLEAIYAHLDTTSTVGQDAPRKGRNATGADNGRSEWGTAIRASGDGRPSLFVRDLADGARVFTFVIWAG